MQNQLLGALTHPPQVGHRKGRNVPRALTLSSAHDHMSAFVTTRDPSRVSRYRRIRREPASRRGFFGFCVTEIGREMALEAIEQRRLIRVDDPACPGDLDELRFVDLPRRASW
jgi:hypothetical protein